MSLVYITYHNENIRDIERVTRAEKHYKFPKYVSIHRKATQSVPINQTEEEGKKVLSASYRYSHKTMGYPETPLVEPSKFLKKNGGVRWKRFNDHKCPPSKEVPPVPKRSEIPKKKEPTKENFIKKNVKKIKTAKCFNNPHRYVDTVGGEAHNLDGTGLVPVHVFSKEFGKTPKYLKAIRKALAKRIDCKDMESKDTSQGFTVLNDCDRKSILTGLRANHLELYKVYQSLPLFTDTIPKKMRKSKIEQELKKLEQDILLIESNPVILICDE